MKNDNKAQGVAVSEDETKPDALTTTTTPGAVALDNGDVEGVVSFQLSQELIDSLSLELKEALHQVEQGFGELSAPGAIYAMDLPFHVIDACTIPDYVDRKTGEEKIKHVFRLEFADGTVRTTMQSDARPRRVLASIFTKARALGGRVKAGPFKYDKKPIPGQIQPAFILLQQPGFSASLY